MLAAIPLARAGSPEDVAAAVSFLASPGAGYVKRDDRTINGWYVHGLISGGAGLFW